MRFSHGQHRFYGGIDLHARTLSLGVLDHDGRKLLPRAFDASPEPEPNWDRPRA
jgi:hypothetical protein